MHKSTFPAIGISLRGLSRSFGATRALDSVSADFEPGLLHGIIGPDGAGKTTLLRILAGLLHPGDGKLTYRCGADVIPFDDVRPSLAYMPSKPSLYPDLSIAEHLEFFRKLYQLSDKEFREKEAMLFEITRLGKFRDRLAGNLSGGMYKKLGLMCALLQSPSVLLLDEPTNGVDPISRREFWELLYSLQEQHILVLISTAYMDEAERCARVHLFESGKLIRSGEPGALLKVDGAKSFDEVFMRGTVDTELPKKAERNPPEQPGAKEGASLNAVVLNNLKVSFGSFNAVDDISFEVRSGEIFGFLGANGAGKTTTIRVLCGLLSPTSGTVRVAGMGFEHGENALKKKVGYMSQKFTLYDDLTVEENMYFKAALRSIPKDAAKKRMGSLLEFIGFAHPVDTMVRDLPSGVKQQISLAATLLHEPEIIFLDEPTSGVSPAVRRKFWALIRKLSQEKRTVIVTTHYMDEAEQCERIALMRSGKLIALDSPEGLKKSTYPEPLVELSGPQEGIATLLDSLAQQGRMLRSWPYGLHYHAIMRDNTAARDLLSSIAAPCMAKVIAPSLEDVFIRLVEGKER